MDVRNCMEEGEIEDHLAQSSALGLETMELQWKSYVSNLKESGALSNALAVCDVSGSMNGQPMQVSLAFLTQHSLRYSDHTLHSPMHCALTACTHQWCTIIQACYAVQYPQD